MDFNSRLVVGSRAEDFRFARWNRRVALYEFSHDTAQSFDAEGEWRHIQQQHAAHIALEHASLDRSADCDYFVWVHALMRLLLKKLLRRLDHPRHARHATDHHQLINVVGVQAGIFQAIFNRWNGSLEEVFTQLLHF